ncbi:unnamed protein product [Cylindrotheca closterium]|uniref:Uncharacterized protein n=1 Tax=Cylindrotheca closterium TaxID=2856 RepID=A0AAD2FI79_9STRA|nr:unnamed protein product [Cylindrotheca closterium]
MPTTQRGTTTSPRNNDSPTVPTASVQPASTTTPSVGNAIGKASNTIEPGNTPASLDFAVETLMQRPLNRPLMQSLQHDGIFCFGDLLLRKDTDLLDLKYDAPITDGSGADTGRTKLTQLDKANRGIINALLGFTYIRSDVQLAADTQASSLMTWLTTKKLVKLDWPGKHYAFVLHWLEQARLYNEIASDKMADSQFRILLANAIQQTPYLCEIKTSSKLLSAQTGQSLTYPQQTIEAFQAFSYCTTRPQLDNATWQQLDDHARRTWHQIPDQAKAIILQNKSAPSGRPPPAKFHTMNSNDFLAHAQSASMGSDTTSTHTPAQEPEAVQPDKLLAYLSKQTAMMPGELQRVMSDKMAAVRATKRPPPTPPTQEAQQHAVTINGIKYRSYYHNTIVYSVQKVNTRKHLALIDRGSNGGIAGDDARIIFKTNCTVDVQGIDNHQVTDIPIVTLAGLVHTQHGPAIAIMYQQAYIGKGQSILSSGQMEHFKVTVDVKSSRVGGQQRMADDDSHDEEDNNRIVLKNYRGLSSSPLSSSSLSSSSSSSLSFFVYLEHGASVLNLKGKQLEEEKERDDDDTATTMSFLSSSSSSESNLRVSFVEPLVTEAHYRPYTSKRDKYFLHYNEHDYVDFKMECLTVFPIVAQLLLGSLMKFTGMAVDF